MKKTSAIKKSSAFHSSRLITLTDEQYAQFLTGKIDICAPDGVVIDGIGHDIFEKAFEQKKEFAVDNLRLIEDLIRSCGDKRLDLSPYSALGLANAFMHAQEVIGR